MRLEGVHERKWWRSLADAAMEKAASRAACRGAVVMIECLGDSSEGSGRRTLATRRKGTRLAMEVVVHEGDGWC